MPNDRDIAFFKTRLLAMQDELKQIEKTGKQAADTVELDQSRQGRLSRMDALQAQAMSQALIQRRQIELEKIKMALLRIEDGDYGYCVKCGDEIAHNRLKYDPSVPLCLSCAEKAEQVLSK